jgi:uncharacterized SAM-binding protein YcdF (DUF218 family)
MRNSPGTTGAGIAVVLGAGLLDDGAPTPRTEVRTQAAARLLAQLPDLILVLSGNGKSGQEIAGKSEAEVMAELLRQLGTPSDQLLIEDESIDTNGNVVLTVLRYLQFFPPGTLYVVTSPFHMPRAAQLFRHVLGPAWNVAEWPSEVSEGDERKAEWPSVFFAGTNPGDLHSAVARLLEKGKPRYREVERLHAFLNKAS